MTAYLAPEAIPRSFFAVLEENSAAGTQTGGRRPHRAAPLLTGDGGRQPDQCPSPAPEGNQGSAGRPRPGQRSRPCAHRHPARYARRSTTSGDVAAMAGTGSTRRRAREHRSRRQGPSRPAHADTQPQVGEFAHAVLEALAVSAAEQVGDGGHGAVHLPGRAVPLSGCRRRDRRVPAWPGSRSCTGCGSPLVSRPRGSG
jgi:hypothetical protein